MKLRTDLQRNSGHFISHHLHGSYFYLEITWLLEKHKVFCLFLLLSAEKKRTLSSLNFSTPSHPCPRILYITLPPWYISGEALDLCGVSRQTRFVNAVRGLVSIQALSSRALLSMRFNTNILFVCIKFSAIQRKHSLCVHYFCCVPLLTYFLHVMYFFQCKQYIFMQYTCCNTFQLISLGTVYLHKGT